MSYQMSGQNMPYPPPAPAVALPPRSRFSKWWPISFFITAIIFFIIGGGLAGAWSASSYSDCLDSDYSYYSSYSSCSTLSNKGEFYGAIACFVIGGICKLTAWILLIVWCVKRSRQPTSISYTYQPLEYYGAAAVSAAPPAAVPPYPTAPTPQPKEQVAMGMRYCGHCGAAITTPFCPQCGKA